MKKLNLGMQPGYNWFLIASCIWAIFAILCWNMAFGTRNIYWLVAAIIPGALIQIAVSIQGLVERKKKKKMTKEQQEVLRKANAALAKKYGPLTPEQLADPTLPVLPQKK